MSNNPPRARGILDDWGLRLTTRPLVPGAKPPMFQVGIYNKTPQFTVYTNHDNGSGVTMLSASMDAHTMFTIYHLFKRMIERVSKEDNPQPTKFKVENKKQIPKEERTDPKVSRMVATETWIGYDENGYWIGLKSLTSASAPLIQFYFGASYNHGYKGIPTAEVNTSAALAWIDLFRGLIIEALEHAGRSAGGQNQGGGQGGSGGGYSKGGGYNKGGNNNYQNKKPQQSSSGGGSGFEENFEDGDYAEY